MYKFPARHKSTGPKAGTQRICVELHCPDWVPAFAGMTVGADLGHMDKARGLIFTSSQMNRPGGVSWAVSPPSM
jgi:hypothetical protein